MKTPGYCPIKHSPRSFAHRFLAVLLAVALVFSFPFPHSAYAQEPQGDGSVENPVLIPADQVESTSMDLDEVIASLGASDVEEEEQSFRTLAVNTTDDPQVVELQGTYAHDTAAIQALYTFESSEYAIIASGVTGIDALSATSLAGALNCPLLLSNTDNLP